MSPALAAPTSPPSVRDHSRSIIGILLVAAFVVILNETTMNVALPSIMADFGVTERLAQWLTTGFMLTMAVVIPVTTQHYPMLQRNLIYTGITRGRKLVVLVGQKKALAMAVRGSTPKRSRKYAFPSRICRTKLSPLGILQSGWIHQPPMMCHWPAVTSLWMRRNSSGSYSSTQRYRTASL